MSPFDTEDRCAIVTGASSGLGRHIAAVLAWTGVKVGAGGRSVDRPKKLVKEVEAFDGRAVPLPLDVTDSGSIRTAIEATETELGPIAILVNNTGVAFTKPFLEIKEADWDLVIETNLKGAYLMS